MEICKMKVSHCQAVYEIAKASLPEHWSYEDIEDVIRRKDNHYFVALKQGKVVGFAGMIIIMDEAELFNIAVEFSERGNGIGKKLMETICHTALEAGACRILLEVRMQNEQARKLYETCGFVEIAVRKQYYNNPDDDAIIMAKQQLLPLS